MITGDKKGAVYSVLLAVLSALCCLSCDTRAAAERPADATACTVAGTLHYDASGQRWEIDYVRPGTMDAVDVYVVKKYEVRFAEDSRKEVRATGYCYLSDEKPSLAGHTVYCIDVTSLEEL
jgi:hypothetical protein